MKVSGLDHVNIDTCRLDETIEFYCELLGLEARVKPSGNSGAWLYCGERAIVHVNLIDDDLAENSTGSFNHVAFAGTDFEATCAALDAAGYSYRQAHQPEIGVSQVFLEDPNGVGVEINIRTPR